MSVHLPGAKVNIRRGHRGSYRTVPYALTSYLIYECLLRVTYGYVVGMCRQGPAPSLHFFIATAGEVPSEAGSVDVHADEEPSRCGGCNLYTLKRSLVRKRPIVCNALGKDRDAPGR